MSFEPFYAMIYDDGYTTTMTGDCDEKDQAEIRSKHQRQATSTRVQMERTKQNPLRMENELKINK